MIFGACHETPASTTFRCDPLQKCWATKFDTLDEYNTCVTEANTALDTCDTPCNDTESASITAATTEQTSCTGECDSAQAACTGECVSAYNAAVASCNSAASDCGNAAASTSLACVAGCDDPEKYVGNPYYDPTACLAGCAAAYGTAITTCGDENASCLAPLAAAENTCEKPCYTSQCSCYAPCSKAYATAAADASKTNSACLKDCCTKDADATAQEARNEIYNDCLNTCGDTLQDDNLTSYKAFIDAVSSDCLLTSGLFPGYVTSPGPPFGTEAERSAMAAYQESGTKNGYKNSECQYSCAIQYQIANKDCSGLSTCILQCQNVWDTADVVCGTAFYNNGTYDDQAKCQLANQKTKWACLQQCCFFQNGIDPYSRCIKTCEDSYNDCEVGVINSCPNYLDNPVCQPASDSYDPTACETATTTYETCVAGAAPECTTTLTSCKIACITAATVPLPCSGCDQVFT